MAVRVTCLLACSGPFGSFAPGQAYELPDAVAADLLAAGYAAKVGKAKNKPPGNAEGGEVAPDGQSAGDA